MNISQLDLDDDAALIAAYHVEYAANLEARPDWVGVGEQTRILGWRSDDGWDNRLLGAWDEGKLCGFAASMTAEDTPDTAWVLAWVDPAHQRQGLGTALVWAAELASPSSATRFVSSAYRASQDDIKPLVHRFAGPLGYELATTETVVKLHLDSADLNDSPVAAGYEVLTYLNGVPEQFREQVARIKGLVDAEAPNGTLGWDATAVTPEEYIKEIGFWLAEGSTVFESIAVDVQGSVVAWTCIVAPSDIARPAQIEGTLVVADHRGRGLGAAVKIACLRRVKLQLAAEYVKTSSDDANIWMKDINAKIGFTPVETMAIMKKQRVLP